MTKTDTSTKNKHRITTLGNLSVEAFLKEVWQKKVAYFAQELQWLPDIEPSELAGYTLEDEVESRILIERPKSSTAQPPAKEALNSQWEQLIGPFDESTFSELPERGWTLLVQAVDHLNPEFLNLRHAFAFIPNWRMDDIMVSYAVDGGNAGPHFDYYDVFLIQLSGIRDWYIGQDCDHLSPMQADCPSQLLADFEPRTHYRCSPGDILYIPPGVAHWGVAQGECMTISVGFRAPSHEEMILDLSQDASSRFHPGQRFIDDLCILRHDNPGLILPEDIAPIQALLRELAEDKTYLMHWFAAYMTQPKRDSICFAPPSTQPLSLAPHARLAYFCEAEELGQARLFANGVDLVCSEQLARWLCNGDIELINNAIAETSLTPSDRAAVKSLKELAILLEPDTL